MDFVGFIFILFILSLRFLKKNIVDVEERTRFPWLTAGADGDWKLQVIKRNHTYFFCIYLSHFMPESQKSRTQWQKATDVCAHTLRYCNSLDHSS